LLLHAFIMPAIVQVIPESHRRRKCFSFADKSNRSFCRSSIVCKSNGAKAVGSEPLALFLLEQETRRPCLWN
jgi:hypothetical protein